MPTSTFSKTGGKRKRLRRRGVKPTAQVKGYQLNRVMRTVKRLIPKPEWKNSDVTQSSTIITSTATIVDLFSLSQGTGEGDIIGDKCRLKSWLYRVSITPNTTAGLNYLRLILVLDHQANGATPSAADILQAPTDYTSPLNDDNGQRFKVLFDKTYTVDTDANGAQVDKVYRRLRALVEMSGSAITNGLFLLQLSDQAMNGPAVTWYSRVRYTDS